MTYILTLQRTRNGEKSTLFVEDYATSTQGTLDVLVEGDWHFLKNVTVAEVSELEQSSYDKFLNRNVLARLEAE